MKRRYAALLAFPLLLVAGCSNGDITESAITIHGTVRDSVTSGAIDDVQVSYQFRDAGGNYDTFNQVVTASGGRYETGEPQTAEPNGYVLFEKSGYQTKRIDASIESIRERRGSFRLDAVLAPTDRP